MKTLNCIWVSLRTWANGYGLPVAAIFLGWMLVIGLVMICCGCAYVSISGTETVVMSGMYSEMGCTTSGTLTTSYTGDRYKARSSALSVGRDGATMSTDSTSSQTVSGINSWVAAGAGLVSGLMLSGGMLP